MRNEKLMSIKISKIKSKQHQDYYFLVTLATIATMTFVYFLVTRLIPILRFKLLKFWWLLAVF